MVVMIMWILFRRGSFLSCCRSCRKMTFCLVSVGFLNWARIRKNIRVGKMALLGCFSMRFWGFLMCLPYRILIVVLRIVCFIMIGNLINLLVVIYLKLFRCILLLMGSLSRRGGVVMKGWWLSLRDWRGRRIQRRVDWRKVWMSRKKGWARYRNSLRQLVWDSSIYNSWDRTNRT